MKRGEIWTVDFGPPSGPEQAGVRPAIILQADAFNASYVTVILVPLTTNLRRLLLPTTLLLKSGEAGLSHDSDVLCHQIQVRGKVRLTAKLGELSPERMKKVEDRLLDALGL